MNSIVMHGRVTWILTNKIERKLNVWKEKSMKEDLWSSKRGGGGGSFNKRRDKNFVKLSWSSLRNRDLKADIGGLSLADGATGKHKESYVKQVRRMNKADRLADDVGAELPHGREKLETFFRRPQREKNWNERSRIPTDRFTRG